MYFYCHFFLRLLDYLSLVCQDFSKSKLFHVDFCFFHFRNEMEYVTDPENRLVQGFFSSLIKNFSLCFFAFLVLTFIFKSDNLYCLCVNSNCLNLNMIF